MLKIIKDIITAIKITGIRNVLELKKHSSLLGSMFRDQVALDALIALEKCGIMSRVFALSGFSLNDFTEFDNVLLGKICDYLHHIGILNKTGDKKYSVKNQIVAKRLSKAVYASMAYNEPIRNLDKLLKKDLCYGRDIERNDHYDAIASADLTSKFFYGFADSTLTEFKPQSLIDLGCGTGDFLAFLEKKSLCGWKRLMGIDLSEKAINEGKGRGIESGITKLSSGNALDLKQNSEMAEPDVISIMFVLHEFEDDKATRIINNCRRLWPDAKILLTEMIRLNDNKIRKSNGTVVPELNFVHSLSYQIIRSKTEWERLFAASGYKLLSSREHSLTYTFCLLFSPHGKLKDKR